VTGTTDGAPEPYAIAHVRDALASDPRVAALGLEVLAANGVLVLLGRVDTEGQREGAGEVAHAAASGYEIRNDLEVIDASAPPAPPEHLT
jgi:osmotically-inducible protein OsmY